MLGLTDVHQIPHLSRAVQSIQSYNLVIITDGRYNPINEQGSHAWSLSTYSTNLWTSAGPCIGLDDTSQSTLGWDQFLRGRISKTWRNFFTFFKIPSDLCGSVWTKRLIVALWCYTEHLWKDRNGVVHGKDKDEQKRLMRDTLLLQVADEYENYNKDPFIISRSMSYLFDKHSIQDRLLMNSETLQCWLCSVAEARQLQSVAGDNLKKHAAAFFPTRPRTVSWDPALTLDDYDETSVWDSDWESAWNNP
jgi:hypothetical protein